MTVVFNQSNRLFQKRLTFNADVRDANASKSASNKPSPRSNSKKNAIAGVGAIGSYGIDFLPITAGVGSGATAGTGPGSGSVGAAPPNSDNSFVVQVSAENFKGASRTDRANPNLAINTAGVTGG